MIYTPDPITPDPILHKIMIDSANPIIRQITIDLITDTSNHTIDWFNNLWNQLIIEETNIYHQNGGEFIYYRIYKGKKQCIFYRSNNVFWCNYDYYWMACPQSNYIVIVDFTKLLVENILNTTIAQPEYVTFDENSYIDRVLNRL